MPLKSRVFLAALLVALSASSAELYWDTDTDAPLVGSISALGLGGSYFSTSPNGNTSLTTIGDGNRVYFQTWTLPTYTCNLDATFNIESLTVSNANALTISTGDGNMITCSDRIVITDNSRLTFKHTANARVLDSSVKPVIRLGQGSNTFVIVGNSSSLAYWIAGLSGDADDRAGTSNSSHWVVNTGDFTFGGQLFGPWRLSAGTMILTGDSPDFTGVLEGGSVTLGDGGTSGSMGSARRRGLGTMRFNRSDVYVFSNVIDQVGHTVMLENQGSGSVVLTSDVLGTGTLALKGDRGTLQGRIRAPHRMSHSGPGLWVIAGPTNSAGKVDSPYATTCTLSGGGDLQIGDGQTRAALFVTNNMSVGSDSDLVMNIKGGARLTVTGNLTAGTGSNLRIIGGGQVEPVITFGGSFTPFENVVYNGETNSWADAQLPRGLGRTNMEIVEHDIYILPLPPGGTVVVVQ